MNIITRGLQLGFFAIIVIGVIGFANGSVPEISTIATIGGVAFAVGCVLGLLGI